MSLVLQNLLVLIAVVVCLGLVVRQGVLSLRGRKSKLGGCGGCNSCGATSTPQRKSASRVVFLPVELLGRHK